MVINRMVVAVDGSDHSRKAADVALDIAGVFNSEVVVLNVAELKFSGAATWSTGRSKDLEAFLDGVVRAMRGRGADARLDLRDAPVVHVGQEIADAAAEGDADLIVIGSRGLSRLPAFVLGSVTTRVLHVATCPVLVVR